MECSVKEHCEIKSCQNSLNYMTEENCTCRLCLEKLNDKNCELSGDLYNTYGDCLALK